MSREILSNGPAAMNDKMKINGQISPNVQGTAGDSSEMISQKLKELYDSVYEEGVSDRFLDLLERLDEAEKNSRSGGSS
jgi:hypothetical protein